MNLTRFNESLLYSNKNVEKLARKLINESSNAVLMEMFDDKCILADHTTGQIFESTYSFNGSVFEFSDFNEVSLEEDKSTLKEAIGDYFDDKNINLAEEYEKTVYNKSDAFESSLTEALISKNMDNVINYGELEGISEEVNLKDNASFKLFEERIETNPTASIKFFNWKDPVKVALIDEDTGVFASKSMKAKAAKLKSDFNFKKDITEAALSALKGDNELLEDLVNENSSIVSLDKSELKELVGISVIGNKSLMENRNKIVGMIENIISESEELSDKKDSFEAKDENETDAPEATEEDTKEIVKALETAADKAKDEKLKKKIEDLIDSISVAADSGETDVGAVKEAVEILSL